MDTLEAIRAVVAAGRGSEIEELLKTHGATASRVYDEIRSDGTLTEGAKRWKMALAYTRARDQIDRKVTDMASRSVRADKADAERVFGVQGLPGDEASLSISRRDAGDRVARITEAKELRELLRRATRSGDEVLARAIAEKALDNLDDKTMNQFLADRPELDAAANRLWNAQRAGNQSLGMSMHLMGLRPGELSGMTHEAIEALANAEPTASSAPLDPPSTRRYSAWDE